MKQLIFILLFGLLPWAGFSQGAVNTDSNATDTALNNDVVPDHGEAGGIDANEINNGDKDSTSNILIILISGAIGAALGLIIAFSVKRKNPEPVKEDIADSKLFIDERVEKGTGSPKVTAAEVKKLKDEIKSLKLNLAEAKDETTAYKKNLDIYTDFDQKYYNEAFRKLVSPMNDAMEKGSRKDIMENLLKIMSHFSSLTRYKIAKKQPYDEPNMQYLMNQRMKNDVAVEIDKTTPVDKIPKNIKTLLDLLSEQSSTGLDDSIISGYKIKNL